MDSQIENATLKATSLLYLKDALEKERFEECTQLAEIAKLYGAKQSDINKVIAMHVRGMKKKLKGCKGKKNGRKRF